MSKLSPYYVAMQLVKKNEEIDRLRKALEETQKALQWGDPENAISRAFSIIHHALVPAKWTVVNTVYFNDNSNEIYGYQVKDEDNTMRRIISSKTCK